MRRAGRAVWRSARRRGALTVPRWFARAPGRPAAKARHDLNSVRHDRLSTENKTGKKVTTDSVVTFPRNKITSEIAARVFLKGPHHAGHDPGNNFALCRIHASARARNPAPDCRRARRAVAVRR